MPSLDIRPEHWVIVQNILHKHIPQYAVWAFGSRVKGTAKPYSDLDLAIITEQPLGLETLAALAEGFSESDLPWKVDIVDWATTSPTFRDLIAREKYVVQEVTGAVIGAAACTASRPLPTPPRAIPAGRHPATSAPAAPGAAPPGPVSKARAGRAAAGA
ncbi:MAG TPA: nucleotidyltransferase domain-containing protein, partial [Candidatus Competibacteraceae bacterium]|nr:nucleotidyltransferase domain-containing protein [Candidatus Competibacteraceae bacterium]